jgi:2'-5' RNA ligase
MVKQLETLYSQIHSENCAALSEGKHTIDPILQNSNADARLGISLLIKVAPMITDEISSIENEIKVMEPDQYYYPKADLHITVIDLIAAHEEFRRNDEQIEEFILLVKKAIKAVAPFELMFKGIILSSIGVLAKGYYTEGLQDIRNRIRCIASERGIRIQERYQSISAHTTFIRFSSMLKNHLRLISFVADNLNRKIGSMAVKELSLVIHDWYNRRKEVIKAFHTSG